MNRPILALVAAELGAGLVAAGCGEEGPIQPEQPRFCNPMVICADAVSNEAGFAEVTGVVEMDRTCYAADSGKIAHVGATPIGRGVVSEKSNWVKPNVSDRLTLPAETTAILRATRNGFYRLRVIQGDGDGYRFAFEVSDVESAASCVNFQARVRRGEVQEPFVIEDEDVCFECLLRDQRACNDMTEAEQDFCRCHYDPSIENDALDVGRPTSPDPDVSSCQDVPPQASVKRAVRRALASVLRREKEQRGFREFVARRA